MLPTPDSTTFGLPALAEAMAVALGLEVLRFGPSAADFFTAAFFLAAADCAAVGLATLFFGPSAPRFGLFIAITCPSC
jgi:hypothetical protein